MHNLYTQSIDHCFEKEIGANGLSQSAFEVLAEKAAQASARQKDIAEAGGLRLYQVPYERTDLDDMAAVADHLLQNTEDLFVLGIGGSSLGAQALAQIAGWGTQAYRPATLASGHPTRFHFLENPDAPTMSAALASVDLATTRFLVVSKSGGTAEPLLQLMTALDALQSAGFGSDLARHMAVITEPPKNGTSNILRAIAEQIGCPTIEHDPGVGGRFSALTNVGLLPALMMGLDPVKVREGAAAVLEDAFANNTAAPIVGAALGVGLEAEKGCTISVLFSYADRLEKMGLWYRQLWAESLGKDGKGTLPVTSVGPTDQHSQLQLYLGGPKDKFYTVMTTKTAGQGPKAPAAMAEKFNLAYLADRTIGDLVDAEQRATYNTLVNNQCVARRIDLPAVTEETIGALMMHFMLETIITADLIQVDPYDQPAVEEGKVLARQYLNEMKT